MKTYILLCCTTIFAFSPINLISQNAKVKIEEDKILTVDQVFELIMDQTNYKFFYEEGLFKNMPNIKVKKGTENINRLLSKAIANGNFDITITDNNAVIVKDKLLNENLSSKTLQSMISGKVVDENGMPLPGASILEKGTTNATSTDFDGNFKFKVSNNAVIVVSYIGYKPSEIFVKDQTTFTIKLLPDVSGLDEVVVIGYGAVKKKDVTGSVTSLNSETITKTTIPDVAGAMQGRMAGVNVQKNVGRPGSGFSISVRGLSSINNTNTPLYVVDGIPTTEGLTDLNPNDIASIDVLKDASATAIYGSRGANGVVIVTTKKGSSGKFTIKYDSYYGVRTPNNLPDMMNGDEYVRWRTDLFTNLGKSTDRSNADFFTSEEWDIIDNKKYTNWQKLMLRDGIQSSNTITASGGDSKGTFAVSMGQLREEGTVKGQDYNRYNVRLNIDRKFSDKWEAGGNLYAIYSLQNIGSYEAIRSTYRMPAVGVPYNEDGSLRFRSYRNNGVINPLFENKDDGENRQVKRYRVFGNFYLQFKPSEEFTLRTQISPQMVNERSGYSIGQYSKAAGGLIANTWAGYGVNDQLGYVFDNQLTYKKSLGDHRIGFTAVQSAQYEQWETTFQEAKGLPFNSKWYNLDAVTKANIVQSSTDYKQRSLLSFLGRFNYDYKGKYLFSASGRYDGSSRLAEGNKWAFFPSAAFAWNISDESFMSNLQFVNNLKARLSYGVTGNDAVDIYGTQSNISPKDYDFGGTVSTAYYKSGLSNYNLTWEKTTELNFGIDYGLFDHRINGTLDIYRRDAKDLIMRRQLPETTGWGSIWDNVGWVRNSGIELGINTVNIENKNFTWETSIVFDTNKNEIVELYGEKKDDIGNRWFIGKPIQVNYDYVFDGIWQLNEADLAAQYGQTPGQIKVKDLNNDKVIDANDRKIIGQRTPKWTGSITNNFKFKDWDFSVYVYTRQGQQLSSTFVSSFMALEGDYNNLNVNYWTANNPTNKYPMPGNKGKYFNSYQYRDVSFVRIGNISLGYNLPKKALESLKINRLRVYTTATNPFIFTKYPGFDPEWGQQNTWGEATGYASYLVGLNLEF
ncbi:SusC/RagA family TonB-linked outer membrane protein [Flavobacterium pokkalii]|nr:TonB-dependent receptor [Flavobacterium pokkalii]